MKDTAKALLVLVGIGIVALAVLRLYSNSPAMPESGGGMVEFNITARQWAFEPSEIRVKVGDRVRLNIRSVDVTHGIYLPDFGISATLEPGKTETLEFTATKPGSFEFACSVYCGEGHGSMRGRIIVEG